MKADVCKELAPGQGARDFVSGGVGVEVSLTGAGAI